MRRYPNPETLLYGLVEYPENAKSTVEERVAGVIRKYVEKNGILDPHKSGISNTDLVSRLMTEYGYSKATADRDIKAAEELGAIIKGKGRKGKYQLT